MSGRDVALSLFAVGTIARHLVRGGRRLHAARRVKMNVEPFPGSE
jgi:hypothetical protein